MGSTSDFLLKYCRTLLKCFSVRLHVITVVLINRITGFARLSVCLSRMGQSIGHRRRKPKVIWTFLTAGVTGVLIFNSKGQRSRSSTSKISIKWRISLSHRTKSSTVGNYHCAVGIKGTAAYTSTHCCIIICYVLNGILFWTQD